MNTLLHYATCPVWESGVTAHCDCFLVSAWRIRKEPGEQFPWRIWRRTNDNTWEPLMRASTYAAAVALVNSMMDLRINAVERDSHA